MQNHFESAPMKIGKHFWRIVITPEDYTEYQFRRAPYRLGEYTVRDITWHPAKEWPGYDINDGTYGGLPRTLRKLWEANRVEIDRILHSREPAQKVLL